MTQYVPVPGNPSIVTTTNGEMYPATVSISPWQPPKIQPQRECRNGQLPNATFQNRLATLCNQIARYRSKELFRSSGQCVTIGNANVLDEVRWRFAGHTSPLADTIVARVVMASVFEGGQSFDPYCRLDIVNSAGGTLASGDFHFGQTFTAPTDAPSEWSVGTIALNSSTFRDTDIRGVFTDKGATALGSSRRVARSISACVYEIGATPQLANGYVPQSYGIGTPISDEDRAAIQRLARQLWKRGGAPLGWFSSETDALAPTTTSAAYRNVIDNTAIGSVGPIVAPLTIADLRYCSRSNAATTVPCRFEAFVGLTVAGAGTVRLYDSAGTALATLSITGGSGDWYTTTVDLPASLQSLYVYHQADALDTITTYACSLYQYQA